MLNSGESTQPAAHCFYRRHDNSRDLRGMRANPAIARSLRCAEAIGAPERHRSRCAGRPLQHRPGCSGLGREPGFGPRALGFHSSRQRPTSKDSHPAQLSGGVRTSARADLRPRRRQSLVPAARANRKRDCSFPPPEWRPSGSLMFSLPAYSGRAVLVLAVYARRKHAGQRG